LLALSMDVRSPSLPFPDIHTDNPPVSPHGPGVYPIALSPCRPTNHHSLLSP
jgi:hypothetical protein